MKTKDRIIQGSLELFNIHGERNITTNHIADHLGISPGNLYYHYRNKDDIIRSIYDLYEENLGRIFTPEKETSVGIDEMMSYLDRVFYSMWEFRFLYANLPNILARDDVLHKRYLAAQKAVYERLVRTLNEIKSQGHMVLADDMIDDLAHTLKLVVMFWISYQHIQNTDEITQVTISQGVLKILNIMKGYATDSGLAYIKEMEDSYSQIINGCI